MTRLTKFSDAFWGTDFCSTGGFDTLVKRMKDGKQMCKDFEDFLKARAKLEEEYSKGLQRLVKNAGGAMEIGSLKTSWDILKAMNEKIAHEHMECSSALSEAARRLSDFSERQKTRRKTEEENTKKYTRKKIDLFNKTMMAKKNYESSCKESEQIDVKVNTAKNAAVTTIGHKEFEKLYQKQIKLKTDMDKADALYRTSVENLEQARQQWEREMTNICNVFQQLEEGRICFLRNEMWVHTNILSQTYVDNDEHLEDVRKSLESCSVDKDIIEFINQRKTGIDKPVPIQYEPWTTGANSNTLGRFNMNATRPAQPLPESIMPPGLRQQHNRQTEDALYSTVGSKDPNSSM